ncbi:Uncharacterised protein [Providencia stuartii]|nr:Uncharacterised protein [Providencia stuartii]
MKLLHSQKFLNLTQRQIYSKAISDEIYSAFNDRKGG